MEIIVEQGLRYNTIEDAAAIYAEAFERKLIKIIGNRDVLIKFFINIINPDRVIAAYNHEGKLLGIAGYRFEEQMMINIKKSVFLEMFGSIKGFIKYLITKVLYKRDVDDELQLLMDGIAVDRNYRGKGIGKLLFSNLEEFAVRNNLKTIKLDVIDENPKAKRLYERIGFKDVKYKKFDFVTSKIIGVSGVTTMIKEI
jgi:ribosomal protein S18 acetylase RimI-like enzyme